MHCLGVCGYACVHKPAVLSRNFVEFIIVASEIKNEVTVIYLPQNT